ncbi:peptidase T2 asparaginase 2 [Pyrolobus fumarii 1A]|uniref:Plant-type L-asparaginase n=1 Tax=Pyrolobus fumarii (strain DSM 11204 / 1A) TaxID=694429 RepID=G0EC66_PYRF1|nr:isoaspartyl peptidase/L-asparaginase [Pyrolobus fumarii]AEM39436.1 peptidase T2 asparaginase 2 [Pyrolobus fumarii 1A]
MSVAVAHLGCSREGIVVTHGGAGGWDKKRVVKALDVVREAARVGYVKLVEGDVLDAVVAAVKFMEDSGVLNAGLGSVLTLDGVLEMDAGLMTSWGLVGAVAGVQRLRNPILAALVVALETPHVIIAGEGADALGESFGVAAHPGPMPERVATHAKNMIKSREKILARIASGKLSILELNGADTVGAVAYSPHSGLAAATSTGGVSGKLRGRVGDTPIPGAGFYATRRVACSATGIGETIILSMACRCIAELIEDGEQPEEALRRVVEEHTRTFGENTLGVIIVDANGCGYAATNARMPTGVATPRSLEACLVTTKG